MESARTKFPFPYQPYNIQEQFMQALYSTLDQGKIGIFESPTGTVCMFACIQQGLTNVGYMGPMLIPILGNKKILISDISADILYIIFWMWSSNMCDKDS